METIDRKIRKTKGRWYEEIIIENRKPIGKLLERCKSIEKEIKTNDQSIKYKIAD